MIPLTNPYEHQSWCLGTGDDFVCFDVAVVPHTNLIRLHAFVNSETAHFAEDFEVQEVPARLAVTTARQMLDRAADWCLEPFSNTVRLPRQALSKPAARFLAAVRRAVREAQQQNTTPHITESQLDNLTHALLDACRLEAVDLDDQACEVNDGLRVLLTDRGVTIHRAVT